jgi:hypothetical protein
MTGAKTRPGGAAAAIERLYFAPVSVHPIVLCRIFLGTILFSCYALYAPYIEAIWGPRGVTREYLEQLSSVFGVSVAPLTWAQDHVWAIYALLLVSAAAFAAGFMTRLSGLVMLVCHIFFAESRFHTWGWSPTIMPFIVYVVCGRAGARLSVDAWLRRRREPGRPDPETAPAWPLRLIQLHVLAIYAAAAWHRIDDPGWLRGDVLFEVLTSDVWSRLSIDLHALAGVLRLATWASWSVELLAPFALIWRRTRTTWVVLLTGLHVGLELGAELGWWQPLMVSLLVVFWPRGLARRVVERVERALPGGRCRLNGQEETD